MRPHPLRRNIRIEGLRATGADRAGIVVGFPERAIEGLVFDNVEVRSCRGLLVRRAEIDARGRTAEASDGRPLIEERGA